VIWVTVCIQSSVLQDLLDASGQHLDDQFLPNKALKDALCSAKFVGRCLSACRLPSYLMQAGSTVQIGSPALLSPALHGSKAVPVWEATQIDFILRQASEKITPLLASSWESVLP
jgi:hypothetical protein